MKRDDKTVGKVRRELEATAEIPQLEKTVGKDGKARKRRTEDDTPPHDLDERGELLLRATSAWQAVGRCEHRLSELQVTLGSALIKLREAGDWDGSLEFMGVSARLAERLIKKAKDWGADE